MTCLRWMVLCFCILWTAPAIADSQDPRLIAINPQQLKTLMARTPIQVEKQGVLLSRANRSGLQRIAYQLAKQQAQKHPKSADAQYIFGRAARYYAEDQFLNHKGDTPAGLYTSLLPVIREHLNKAYSMNPRSALFNLGCGFWLWQFGGDMSEGLRLVKHARLLDPRHVGTVATLGEMYANRSGNCYDPKKAERALRLAIRLDPSYAYPRVTLLTLLYNQKRYKEAKQQLSGYISVLPVELAQSPEIKAWKAKLAAY